MQRELPEIIPFHSENVESVELNLVLVLATVQRVKSETPSTPRMTASPSTTKCFCRFFKAASATHG